MKRYLSLILVIGLLLNIVIPVYASESVTDYGEVGGFWSNVIKVVDLGCAGMGVAAAVSGGAACATPVSGAVCGVCAGWAFARAVGAFE